MVVFTVISLVLICRRCICNVAAGTVWTTSRTNENMRRRQQEPSPSFTASLRASSPIWASERRSREGPARLASLAQMESLLAGYFTAGMPAKLNLRQLRRHAGGKDWDDQCCPPLLFSYRNSIPASTSGHVAGASAAYENQALRKT